MSISEKGGWITGDTYVSPETYRISLLAAGGLITAAEAILVKEVENAFALVRPPGHHAEADRAMGFCYLNNPAVCARHLQAKHKLEKILIVDWDAHAANGTTQIFYSDPTVLVISIHQDPETLYPGTGFIHERGAGEGEGFTVNIPVPPGTGDADYAYIFGEFIEDKVDGFRPDFVIASTGFDSHRDDPLAELNLTEDCYAHMTGKLMEHAKRRLLVELEGGYNLKALACSAQKVVEALLGGKPPKIKGEPDGKIKKLVSELRSIHGM
jgi:acetoin utilization deacetylase AcuC-like enzyme